MHRIARWDGPQWTQPGDGLSVGVHALTVYNNLLIAGGEFSHPGNYIAN